MTEKNKKIIEQINNGIIPDGYKKTKVGIVPVEWEVERFQEIAKRTGKDRDKSNNNFPVYSINNKIGFTSQDSQFENNGYSNTSKDLYKIVYKDEFAYNPARINVGSIGLLKDQEAVIISSLYICFKMNDKCKNSFFEQYFKSYRFNFDVKNYTEGSVREYLFYDNFSKIHTVLPPFPEQQKIAEILSTQDKLIELYERKIEQLKTLKKGYLQKMFPKKGCKYPELRFKGFTDPWEQRKLGEVVGIYDGVHKTPNYQDVGVMFLSVENITTLQSTKFISEEDFRRDYKVFPQKNDILMTRIGDVGTTNVVTDNDLKAYYVSLALLKYKNTNPYFLSNAIQSDFVQKGLANRTLKTAIPMKINKDEIGKVNIMLPISAKEQTLIGTYFKNLDNLITLHQHKLDKEKQKKKALMQLLLTGKVRVST